MKKKIIAMITGLAIVAMIVPAPAGATTVAELQEQIDTLLATLADLQSQLVALGGGGVGVTCTFTRALSPGSSGTDVKCLQQYLNDAGYTVAASGVGSAGNETQYYGSLTTAAVGAWQDGNDVVYGAYKGYFGPISQAKYDALAAAGEEEEEEEEEEEDITGTDEGSITATLSAIPADSQDVYTTNEEIAVTAVDVKAAGSDVKIKRLKVNFNKRPWQYISKLHISDESGIVKSIDVTEDICSEVTIGSSYDILVTGLSILVEKDDEETITVSVDGTTLPVGTTSQAIQIQFKANALRGIDGADIDQYAPSSDLSGSWSFTVKNAVTGSIELSAASDNPDIGAVLVSETVKTEDIVLIRADLKAKYNDVILRKVRFEINCNDASDTDDVLPTAKLYDGDTLLKSTSTVGENVASSNNAVFGVLDLVIAKGTTKTLVLKVDAQKRGGYYATGTYASGTLSANAGRIEAEDADTYATTTVTGSAVNAGGIYFYIKAPTITLASQSIRAYAPISGSSSVYKAETSIKLNITANGGDIYLPKYSSAGPSTGLLATTSARNIASCSNQTFDSSGGDEVEKSSTWLIQNGETGKFTVSGILETTSAKDGFVRLKMAVVKWSLHDSPRDALVNTWAWGLLKLKTNEVFLEKRK